MKSIVLAAALSSFLATEARAEEAQPPTEAPNASAPSTAFDESVAFDESEQIALTPAVAQFCFFAGKPPTETKYQPLRRMKLGRKVYGTVRDILPKFVTMLQAKGADAVMLYSGSQRFGFWPWRLVRPVVYGTGIKWLDPKPGDCASMGGTTLQTILDTDLPPPR